MAGLRKGHRLKVPGGGVRPTSEKVREAIFDVLGSVTGLSVLDLFAGTGALGLEALSRGAARSVFVEADPRVADVLRENIWMLGFQEKSQLLVVGYHDAVRALLQRQEEFDLLFIDPPYRMLDQVEKTLSPFLPALLSANGLVVVESDRALRPTMGGTPVFDRIYGSTRVTMIRFGRSGV
ncbi:MAG: 16S rRNA (guanine(966)-N(2))-methyltransferase RsmD [Thermoleophilia bacterium]|nr:16S rRNA (guanine(966)-N(2))-methyltransferase RsmD [Thermoleophilia bacterium]